MPEITIYVAGIRRSAVKDLPLASMQRIVQAICNVEGVSVRAEANGKVIASSRGDDDSSDYLTFAETLRFASITALRELLVDRMASVSHDACEASEIAEAIGARS